MQNSWICLCKEGVAVNMRSAKIMREARGRWLLKGGVDEAGGKGD